MSQIVIEQQREANEKSLRSVFVGNIPYETTEESLKDIFAQVGPVLSFRLVYDRDTGKPKGYGFCEYQDQETAKSAMRNLSGYELNGRSLRVDTATSDKSEEIKSLGPTGKVVPEVSPYGAPCPPDNAPEAISQAVASLPPEQMFELMTQMKKCILGNPDEAKKLLLQNSQLAYALLQALVVMRVLDPSIAQSILHGVRPKPVPHKAPGAGQPSRPPPPAPIQHQPAPPPPQNNNWGNDYHSQSRSHAPPPDRRGMVQGYGAPAAPPPQPAPHPHRQPQQRAPSNPRPAPPPAMPLQPSAEKEDLIRQVMMLSDEQIQSLPEEQRNTLLIFKQQYNHGAI
ncbi:hypothetical protein ACHWQZ_G012742 [Mnemiopsis leidyi]